MVERDLQPIIDEGLARLSRETSEIVELMEQYLEPISVRSLAVVRGLGEVDPDTLRRWFAMLADGATNFERDQEKQARADLVATEIDETLRPLFERMIRNHDGSVVSTMLHAVPRGLDERVALVMPTLKVILLGGMQEPGRGAGPTLRLMASELGLPHSAAGLARDQRPGRTDVR